MNTSPRIRAEQERAEEEARRRADAAGREERRASEMAQAEEAGRLERAAAALPDSLFDNDAKVAALRSDLEAKSQRHQTSLGGFNERVHTEILRLKQSIKLSGSAIRDAALDDAFAGDMTFARLTAAQQKIDADRSRLTALETAMAVTSNREAVSMQCREELQRAAHALEQALLARKRQHVREHPDLIEGKTDVAASAGGNDQTPLAHYAPPEEVEL